MPDIHIEQIRHELTWKLRHQVLYPNVGTIHTQGMAEDLDGIHFGAFVNGWLVGVVSLFQTGPDFQFRKFAVADELQGKGVGTELLRYITEYALEDGGERLWCNARLSATGFYQKAGFIPVGEEFERGSITYIMMEKNLS